MEKAQMNYNLSWNSFLFIILHFFIFHIMKNVILPLLT